MSVQVKGSGTIGGLDEGLVVSGIVTSSPEINVGSNIKLGSAGVCTATSFVGSGANLTSIPAGQLTGTVADARISTLTSSKLSGALPAISGANLTNLDASDLASGTVPTARLGSGTASSSTFLAGDSTYKTVTGTTINSNADNRVITGSGTANTLEGESTLTYAEPTLEIATTNSSYGALKLDGNSGGLIEFKDNGTRKWELYGANNFSFYDRANTKYGLILKPGGDLEIPNGNLVMGTAGSGIDFSADNSGTLKTLPNSFNAELLHDYENGTFTPNIQYDTGTNRYSGSNVSSAVGEYIRIGDLVNFGMKITLTGNRNVSENIYMYIGGLPYNGMHTSQQSSMMQGWGGWVCPSNDSNSSYKVHNCKHSYTTVDVRFSQSSGTGGISGFFVWGFYRTAP